MSENVGIRHCVSAGENLPDHIIASWEKYYNIPIYQALGTSEFNTFIMEKKLIFFSYI